MPSRSVGVNPFQRSQLSCTASSASAKLPVSRYATANRWGRSASNSETAVAVPLDAIKNSVQGPRNAESMVFVPRNYRIPLLLSVKANETVISYPLNQAGPEEHA